MMKKLSVAIVFALLVAAALSATAFAAPDDFSGVVDKANAAIAAEIDKAQKVADIALHNYQEEVAKVNWQQEHGWISTHEANERIERLQSQLKRFVGVIAARLIWKTERIVNHVIDEAKERGITIDKVYVDVNLAGYVYSVDPLRIVGN